MGLLAGSLALRETRGDATTVNWRDVAKAFKRFGFLYPETTVGLAGKTPAHNAPLGLSVGTVSRTFLPIRIRVLNVGCAACHAGTSYQSDGRPDLATAVPGMPNTSLNLEAFTVASYSAMKAGLASERDLFNAIARLFPDMGLAERMTLRWVALPAAQSRLTELANGIDRPLPFRNGVPGSTNGVAALKHQLGLLKPGSFEDTAGFVSIPVLADRYFRSALLVDGAYAVKGTGRFVSKGLQDAAQTKSQDLAAVASFFLVPSMGMTDQRAAAAIPDLTQAMSYLRNLRPPPFPGVVDPALAAKGRDIYAGKCSRCHGTYDKNLNRPALQSFPNWAGDVGTDMTRVTAFTTKLQDAIAKTLHGRRYLDAARTGKITAPLLSGLWASAPYFSNGSVPTVESLLDPPSRPQTFMVGGHTLDLVNLGIALVKQSNGSATYASADKPFSAPALIDTRKPGFSNNGHDNEVAGLDDNQREALIEYLKLL